MRELLQDPDAWTEIAVGYEQEARALLTPFSSHAIERGGLGCDDDVLDVACGPGTTTLLAAPSGSHRAEMAEVNPDENDGLFVIDVAQQDAADLLEAADSGFLLAGEGIQPREVHMKSAEALCVEE